MLAPLIRVLPWRVGENRVVGLLVALTFLHGCSLPSDVREIEAGGDVTVDATGSDANDAAEASSDVAHDAPDVAADVSTPVDVLDVLDVIDVVAPPDVPDDNGCSAGQRICGGSCHDFNDPAACGATCAVCGDGANGSGIAGCVQGLCTVQCAMANRADCNHDPTDGCEIGTLSDPQNCGSCGNVCPAGTSFCNQGTCAVDGAVDIAAGTDHVCALTRSGRILCWGSGVTGQLGNGTSGSGVMSATPVAVQLPTTDPPHQIVAGRGFTCVSTQTRIYCWGANDTMQTGNAGGTQTRPVLVPLSPQGTVLSLTAGAKHACAVYLDNSANPTTYCWGSNASGQIASTSTGSLGPTSVGGSTAMAYVRVTATRGFFTCALPFSSSNPVYCWGINDAHQLGSSVSGGNTQVAVPNTAFGADQLASGLNDACAFGSSDGTLYCWGGNSNGQLGQGTTTSFLGPSHVVVTSETIAHVSVGDRHMAVSTVAHRVYTWGDNSAGQLGSSAATGGSNVPVPVTGFGRIAIGDVAAGADFTCAVALPDGATYCWGNNASGQLGDGTTSSRTAVNTTLPVLYP